jgi:pimeloyl-ACP methyl ester carboxylesterase
VDNAGVRIRYEVEGRGEPLVLVHGWSCEGRYWREFGYVSGLTDHFTVIVPDLRGHGGSDRPPGGDFTDAAFASDVIAVLDDTGIGSAHVFGFGASLRGRHLPDTCLFTAGAGQLLGSVGCATLR